MPKKKCTFIDLFAGLWGFHLALKDLVHTCVCASELHIDLRKLCKINYLGTRIEGDITELKPKEILYHDILCAGFPCQTFSQAGYQMGFNDEKRGYIFYVTRDILREKFSQHYTVNSILQ